MNLPQQPATFRAPTPSERPWWWRLHDEHGGDGRVPEEYSDQRFASQADAESWVGEVWVELAAAGVTSVTLVEHDRDVYGPMSLSA
jgi:hypothetical protein